MNLEHERISFGISNIILRKVADGSQHRKQYNEATRQKQNPFACLDFTTIFYNGGEVLKRSIPMYRVRHSDLIQYVFKCPP